MPNYVIQKDSKTAVPLTITQAQADAYALKFPVYLVNADNSQTFYAGPTAPANIATTPNLGVKNASEIADLNARLAAGTLTLTPGTWLTLASSGTDAGTVYRLKGVGTAAAFSVEGGGSSSSASAYTPVIGDMSKWKAAKARGAANPARFLDMGDSNRAGTGSGSGTNGMVGAVSTSMSRQLANLQGWRIDHFFGDQLSTGAGVTLSQYDPRFTQGAGCLLTAAGQGYGGKWLTVPPSVATRWKVAPANAFDSFKIWYPPAAAGTPSFQVYVDDVLLDTFSSIAADGAPVAKTYTVPRGVHTISVGNGSTTNGQTVFWSGCETRDSQSAAALHLQGAWYGGRMADFDNSTILWGYKPGAVALQGDFASFYGTINNANDGTAVEVYSAAVEDLVAALAPTCNGCLQVGFPSGANSGAATLNGLLDSYARALRRIATDFGWSFFDSRAVFGGSYTLATARGYAYDINHPSLAGHTAHAAAYSAFLVSIGL